MLSSTVTFDRSVLVNILADHQVYLMSLVRSSLRAFIFFRKPVKTQIVMCKRLVNSSTSNIHPQDTMFRIHQSGSHLVFSYKKKHISGSERPVFFSSSQMDLHSSWQCHPTILTVLISNPSITNVTKYLIFISSAVYSLTTVVSPPHGYFHAAVGTVWRSGDRSFEESSSTLHCTQTAS